jgi:hypothetical protein
MTTNDQSRLDAVASDDQIGKIFVALSQDMRQCLICDGVFPTQGAADHSATLCYPQIKESEQDESTLDRGQAPTRLSRVASD